ncbi:MAG: hypothetical protein M3H12_17680 [Chromatiales bacterium]|nr:hypothetical protein [Gammaproteobacteria bacterium]
MFARAFETYVSDKLEVKSQRNDYLTSAWKGTDDGLHGEEAKLRHPRGIERERINNAFDALIQEIKTKKTDKGTAMFSSRGRIGSDRAPWGNFPEIVFQTPLGGAKRHVDYKAAKAGDEDAAFRLVSDLISDKAVQRIKGQIGKERPVVVPVIAEEATGRNKIPLAYAEVLADHLGTEVSRDIVQSRRAKHTDAGAFHRIGVQPFFDGPVIEGQSYLIVDDTMTMGGTLANLRGHIEEGGGHVVMASALTGFGPAANIAITEKMKQRLLNKHGLDLDNYLKAEFGYGIESLTQGEAGHLRKAPGLDAIRDRIAEARRQTGVDKDQADDRGGKAPPLKSFKKSPKNPGQVAGISVSAVEKAIAPVRLAWQSAPTIKVVASKSKLPEHLQEETGDRLIDGVYDPTTKTAYLVADAIPSARQARVILAHEAVGHHSMEEMLGDDFAEIQQKVQLLKQAKDKRVSEIAAEVRERYGELEPADESAEIIAVMAEKGIRNGLMKRVYAAIRRFLRRLGLTQMFTTTELEGMIAKAGSRLGKPVERSSRSDVGRKAVFSEKETAKADLDAIGDWSNTLELRKKVRDFAEKKFVDKHR